MSGEESRSRSRSPSPVENGNGDARSASGSKSRSVSRSASPVKRSQSRSNSRSRSPAPARSHRDSRSRKTKSRSPRRRRSRSRSPYRGGGGRRSRSRSRSPRRSSYRHSPRRDNHRGGGGGHRDRDYDRYGPPSGSGRGKQRIDNPPASRCVGVFGMSLYTNERDLRDYFAKFGTIEDVQLVYDHPTGRSRGFGFVYYENTDDAVAARDRANGIELDGRRIRVDFSITQRPHTPTPGVYMGRPTSRDRSPTRRSKRSRSNSYSPKRERAETGRY